ncbi:DUF6174 domain-containing protein [Phytohabitans sp. LJ34]|uniref:DUF6174 domain-containing protein n=1 Tax=Phytohabitans sp. LJ34 TaxID=3452217 RepID=UPI003F88CC94
MRIVVALLGVLTVAGCAETSKATPPWQEPGSYTYVLQSSCGERPLIGRFRITVEDGKVTKAEGIGESDKRSLESTELTPPTLGQLLDELEEARRNDADLAELTSDPADGHPTKITIDHVKEALDDEACYAISEYRG